MSKRTSSDGKYQVEQVDLFHGECKIYRTPTSGNRWYFKYWVTEDQKYIRMSLKTKDEDFAREKATQLYYQLKQKQSVGASLFPIEFHKVIDLYLEEVKKGIGTERTEDRFKTILSQTKWIKKFKPQTQLKIEDLKPDDFLGYFSFRRYERSSVTNATLKHEQATINGIIKFAIRKKWLPPTFELEFPTGVRARANPRPAITRTQYAKITRYFRSRQYLGNDDNLHLRKFVRDYVLVLANSGMRVSEARRLKWRNIKLTRSQDGKRLIAVISLEANQTKNGKARVVQSRNGGVYKRIRSYSKYTKPNDLVFVNNNSGNQITKESYYRIWRLMLKETEMENVEPRISYYGLRHMYVTLALLKNIPHKVIAQNVGTGLKFIDEHYGQTNTEMFREQLTGDLPEDKKWLWEEEEW